MNTTYNCYIEQTYDVPTDLRPRPSNHSSRNFRKPMVGSVSSKVLTMSLELVFAVMHDVEAWTPLCCSISGIEDMVRVE